MGADDYDRFASAYERENASSMLNAYYERPAMLNLAGDVVGHRILDAGCGSGPLMAALRQRGADVTGIDGSAAMIAIARERLGADTPLHVGDLVAGLPFTDNAFDEVMASLVLHYLEDWSATLAEFRRVLRPDGRLIFSVNHPTARALVAPESDYFATYRYSDEFTFDGETTVLTMWHRPIHAITDAVIDAGFRILRVSEPPPSPDAPAELLTPRILRGESTAFISFLFLELAVA